MHAHIERLLLLKTVELFAAASDEILAELADLLVEEEHPAGMPIVRGGEQGMSMFIIMEGELRVHDGEHTLNYLGPRDAFGEMALLDAEPRIASVTAITEVRLLRLDREPFRDLLAQRIEIARGIIRVLSGHLRSRVRDLVEERTHLDGGVT